MTSEEIGGYIILGIYGIALLGAIRVFGIRRVALVFLGIVVLGLVIAFRTLAAITSANRY